MKKMERLIKTNFMIGFVDAHRIEAMKEKLDKMSVKEFKKEYTWVLDSFCAKINEYTQDHVVKKDKPSQDAVAIINLMKAYLEQHIGFLSYIIKEKKK